MIKTGIHSLSQLVGNPRLKSVLGRDLLISAALYDQILDFPNADALAERILLFLSDERGVYKRTYAHRFEDFDAHLLQLMAGHFDPQAPLILGDVAVSDGRTACDLFERLAPTFQKLTHFASDFAPGVRVLEQGRLTVVLSRNNRLLQMVWPPFVFNVTSPESALYYPLNRLIRMLVKSALVDPLVAKYLGGQVQSREVPLFSVRALNLARQDARFHLGEQNILEPLVTPEPLHIVRAMNVLNASYFTQEDLNQILGNFHAALGAGGWLVTGYNEDAGSQVHGAIFRKADAGFERIWESGHGPQMQDRILAWAPPRS